MVKGARVGGPASRRLPTPVAAAKPQTTDELLAAYRDKAERWGKVEGNARRANLVFEELDALFARLRTSAAGRAGISALLADPAVSVRLLAAGHALEWDEAAALPALEAIAAGTGLASLVAQHTLDAFRADRT